VLNLEIIIVPKRYCEALTIHTHEDIHHQNNQKVTHILKPMYYWAGMDRDIERYLSECEICRRGTIRWRHLKMIFDANAPSSKSLPRQHYGLDLNGVHKDEILVIVDLFSREVIIEHVTSRSQLNVASVLLKHVILSRGVPLSLRTFGQLSRVDAGCSSDHISIFEHRADHDRRSQP
jgi:hypothetical protein